MSSKDASQTCFLSFFHVVIVFRGLIPRLAMYVSQGAIFFASYEFLKAVFSLEPPRVPSLVTEHKEIAERTPSRLQKLHS